MPILEYDNKKIRMMAKMVKLGKSGSWDGIPDGLLKINKGCCKPNKECKQCKRKIQILTKVCES